MLSKALPFLDSYSAVFQHTFCFSGCQNKETTTRESFNAVNHDEEVKMMNRMECKLSQDVRVEARFRPDTTKEPVRIVPELSLKLGDLLVQE